MAVDGLPVFREIAHRVAHGVGVFAQKGGLARALVLRGPDLDCLRTLPRQIAQFSARDHPLDGGVHARIHVRVDIAALPVDRTRRIQRADGGNRRAEVVSVTGFVAERPQCDGRIVAVEDDIAFVPLDNGLLPFRDAPQAVFAVRRLVALHVRLGDEIESIAVAQIVPAIIVRIMPHAHRVDVVALHELHVLDHRLERNRPPVGRVRLVPVHALELDLLSVQDERVARDLLALESDALHANVVALADDQRIEIGVLRRPDGRIGQHRRRRAVRKPGHGILRRVVERGGPRPRNARERKCRGLQIVRQRRAHLEVPDAVLRFRPDRHVAEDAREAEHVLVFEIAAVAPAVDFNRQQVAPGLHQGGDVELARELGVFGIPRLLAVHPHVVGGIHAVEAQDDVAARPVFGHLEGRAVAGDGVVVRLARLAVEYPREIRVLRVAAVLVGVADVGVAGGAETARLHAARHVDRLPG